MARSSTKAEYCALANIISELLWLRWPLNCDNQSAIHIAHNDVFHERTKHIKIDCYFIHYHLVHDALKLFSVSSKDQLVDIFTKSHPKERLRALVDNLKLVLHPPWVWGGLLTCNRLWALGPPVYLYYTHTCTTHYAYYINALLYILLLMKYSTISSVFLTLLIQTHILYRFSL